MLNDDMSDDDAKKESRNMLGVSKDCMGSAVIHSKVVLNDEVIKSVGFVLSHQGL